MTLVAVDWRPECDCTRTGHRTEPAPGRNPAECAECGELVRSRWHPTLTEDHHQPERNHP